MLVVDDDAGAGREGEPVSVRKWAGIRDSSTWDLTGANRPSSSALARRAASTVMQDIGRAVGAFVADALDQLILLAFDPVDA
jgi:hypothetical protein